MEKNDLTLEDLGLVNPDVQTERNFDWPDDFLQRIIGSLIVDDHFLVQASHLVKPDYFRENAHRFICKSVLDYYEKYNGRPSKAILEFEINNKLRDNPARGYYLAELDEIYRSYEPGLQKREYILDQICEFAKTQALRLAYFETLSLLKGKGKEQEKWDKIRNKLQEALLVERNVDLGLSYFETIEERYLRMMKSKEDRDYFPCGFTAIDEALGGGIGRGEMAAFAAMSGVGKSLALVKTGKYNLQKGRNVLYISLEIDEDKLAERFDAMLANVSIRELYFQENAKEVKKVLKENQPYWGKLVIKQFPAGYADVAVIRAFIAQLDAKGFTPDVVIVDYIGEMKDSPVLKTYESRQRLVRDLRGMATELDFAVFTALQVNRGGRDAINEKGYLDDDSLADSIGQVRPLDALWTISQTDAEQKAGCGNIFVSKHRSGRGKFSVKFQRNDNTLEMEEISNERYRNELSKVQDKTHEELELEDMAIDSWRPNRGSGKSEEQQIEEKQNA